MIVVTSKLDIGNVLRPTFSLKNSVFSIRRSEPCVWSGPSGPDSPASPPSSVSPIPARALHCPARSLAGVAARVEWRPSMGTHPWPRFSLRKIHKERGFRRRQSNFVNADDLTRRRLYFQSSLSFRRDGLSDQHTTTLAFSSFLTKLLLTFCAIINVSFCVIPNEDLQKNNSTDFYSLWSSFLTRSPVAVSYWTLN